MDDREMRDLLVEYMGKGFLENIISLFKQEPDLARFIADLISQENMGVRLGATALVEDLAARNDILRYAVPGLVGLLAHRNPTVRGDAASLLGTIGDPTAIEALSVLLRDEESAVREIAKDALEEIRHRSAG